MTLKLSNSSNLTPLLLRIGLSVIFLYAAASSLKNPQDWVGYLPQFLRATANAQNILHVFSVYEILLAIWLISGRYVRYAGLVCALTLTGIVISNFSLFAISFRDIALVFAALALAASAKK